MTTQTSPKPRWGKGAIALIAVTAVFLLAAGAFGTLWILERNDHSATGEQLTSSRTQADDTKAKLRDLEGKQKTLGDKLQEAVTQERTQEVVLEKSVNCADAGRKFAAAVREGKDDVTLTETALAIDFLCV